ncbi:PREDICTED: COBRA-like protein 6 [Nelumbo nucifera]|uniref:COBRA-like protein 6 n=1 Tax=Nelumbo nucifera TaxID=4432 RepID=A0A1U7ZDM0_NELNU|nr:PREDICTED: COBRA-like protein 6 [Nelumbo nucifera]
MDTHQARVSIFNFQLFRHVETPGWKLSWEWSNLEVIWNIVGAEATEQGDCSRIKGSQLPHSCEKKPVIVDLLPGTPYNMQVANCCKGGVLSSMTQDPTKYGAAFQMNVGMVSQAIANMTMPGNFSLGLPGYSCSEPFNVTPSKFSSDNGRRWTQALRTWNVTCSYSQVLAYAAPTCCVSLSAFYNETIVPCPRCSCSCQGMPGTKCIKPGESPLQLPQKVQPPTVMCSRHMCPIRVHWHVKTSYREYWRVKVTVTNLNFVKNYTMWNLVIQHPNLRSIAQIFSFNYKPLNLYGPINDTGMFWGIQYYNDLLLQSGDSGNVQTEMLLHKDAEIFTFREGWAFPRRISFNGDECVMPSPDDYPRLPNSGPPHPTRAIMIFSLSILLTLIIQC